MRVEANYLHLINIYILEHQLCGYQYIECGWCGQPTHGISKLGDNDSSAKLSVPLDKGPTIPVLTLRNSLQIAP